MKNNFPTDMEFDEQFKSQKKKNNLYKLFRQAESLNRQQISKKQEKKFIWDNLCFSGIYLFITHHKRGWNSYSFQTGRLAYYH